jgi:hypothetical protein
MTTPRPVSDRGAPGLFPLIVRLVARLRLPRNHATSTSSAACSTTVKTGSV